MNEEEKKETKNCRFNARMTEDEDSMFDYICDKYGKTRSEVFRDMLKTQYNLALYRD